MILRFLTFALAILFLTQGTHRMVDRGRNEDVSVRSLAMAQRSFHQSAMTYVEANPAFTGPVPVTITPVGGVTIAGPYALSSQAFPGGVVLTWFNSPPAWVPPERLLEELRRLGPGVGFIQGGNILMQVRDRATGTLQTSVVPVTVGAPLADNTPVLVNRI